MLNKVLISVFVAVVVASNAIVPSAAAIDTAPSTPPLVDGPFIISAYGFSGHNLSYAQIANDSSHLASLEGWLIEARWGTNARQYSLLDGNVLPDRKVTIADREVVPGATFVYTSDEPATRPLLDELLLVPPANSGYNNHVVRAEIKSSTSEQYYFARNTSSSTGNYISSFSVSTIMPSVIASDPLYSPATSSALRIVELYPRSSRCSPASASPLCYDYVKVQNTSGSVVAPGQYRIRTGGIDQSSTASNTAQVAELVQPGAYAVIQLNLADSGSHVWVEDGYGITNYPATSITYVSSVANDGDAWAYDDVVDAWRWTQYPTPANMPNDFGPAVPVNACDGLKLSEIAANHDPQYIELYNASLATITVSGCQIQTNRSTTASYVFADNEQLASGQHKAVMVSDTELTLTKTTTGTVYVLNSDGTSEVDAREYSNLDEGTALARVDGTWQQTFDLTPGEANRAMQYPPCELGYERNLLTGRCNKKIVAVAAIAPCPDGKYRNPATNRCKTIVTSEDELAACAPGQYRNPATNRCKAVATSASALKPCDAGEYRNPETNRCNKLASTTSTLKPCEDGYERNSETNRCRKVLGASTNALAAAAFPVQPIPDTRQAFVAWWALGGVLLFGLAYAGWEWRHEIRTYARRIAGRGGRT